MLIVVVLLATVILRVGVVLLAVYLLLPRGGRCRACRTEMLRLSNGLLDRWVPALERRWCLACGWSGIVRRVRLPRTDQTDRSFVQKIVPRP
jgi:hypothetical protein